MNKKIYLFFLTTLLFISCKAVDHFYQDFPDQTQDEAPEEIIRQSSPFQGIEGIECIPDLDTYEEAVVVRVIDGDSIEVSLDGEDIEVRYIGVNTPEYYSEDRKRAVEATQANQELVSGEIVYLFKDTSNTDRYGRLLRYVLTEDNFVNLELVRQGYAQAKEYPPDTACHLIFEECLE